jgi:hypothetical protein
MRVRQFGIMRPDGSGIFFKKSETLAAAQKDLMIGYTLVNELVDGVTVPPMPDGLKHYSFMTSLLLNHGLELREWLQENGCVCQCGGSGGKADAKGTVKA